MAQKTNLNVAPYYDDFNSANNFNRVLFRPGFAVQARELTQVQSALQDQIQKHGDHIFEEGAMVIPGQISFSGKFDTLKLATQFASENVVPSQYYNATTAVTITGATTGVQARVIGYSDGSSTEQPVLHIRYTKTGTNNTTGVFADGENISADAGITHTTSYSSGNASATTFTATSTTTTDVAGPAAARGCVANIESGIYYVRGMFVENTEQSVVISKYNPTGNARIGFTVTETLVTPESDATLTDNATGSNNYAAKGAHRLKITLTLTSLALDSVADSSFIELMRVKDGVIQSHVRFTDYSVLEETLARRTFDESGDYTVRPFQFTTHESVTIDDEDGLYVSGATTDDGNTASDSLLAFKVSPGKAYIKGYEIEKIAPTIKDINKARDTNSVNNGASLFSLGNYTIIDNVFHQPDITGDGGSAITTFKPINIHDTVNATRGTALAATTIVGQARVRHMEYHSGTADGGYLTATAAAARLTKYKLYLFDIKPYTKLTMSGTISSGGALVAGDFITGSTSGATGFIASQASAVLMVTSVVGSFSAGETITVNDRAGATSETISSIRSYSFSDFKSLSQVCENTTINFTADLSLDEDTLNLSGTGTTTDSDTTVVGFGSRYSSEVKPGDTVIIPGAAASNADHESVVASVESNTGFTLVTATHGSDGEADNVVIKRQRAKLHDAEKNVAIVKLPKDVIKTTSDIQYSVRRQFIKTVSGGVVTVGSLTNETYGAIANTTDYTVSLISENSGTDVEVGAIFDNISASTSSVTGKVQFGNVGAGSTQTIDFKDGANHALEDSDVVKVIATITRSSNVDPKTKTAVLSKALKVDNTTTGAHGTNFKDKTISLGRADVFKLQAIYDSAGSSDAIPPKVTVGTITGTFTRGEVITGGSSGAKGRVITTTSPIYYVSTSGSFTVGETITGAYGGGSAVIATVVDGSEVITSNYLLDTGQRDNYYDIARIVRKPSAPAPSGKLLVIYDYLEHGGTGDFYSVNSYVTGATGVNTSPGTAVHQMDYNDIPTYSATKVDPDEKAPTGVFKLADCLDFRPTVANIAGTGTTFYADGGGGVDEITGNSFDMASRVFDTGTGSSTLNFVKANTNISTDFDYYLNKRAIAFINKKGTIEIKEGASAEVPPFPKAADGAMILSRMYIPAYTFKPDDVEIVREKNQRFTMKDIGRLKDRIENIEYYTALNMLERDAESYEIQDANGLNRFKSGFVVDNFTGHRVGDTQHVDYRIGMDMENGEMRPIHHTEAVALEESVSLDSARTTAHYQKTGDLLTLPYTEQVISSQPYATGCEKVTPLLTSNWLGMIELGPNSDEWFETELAPRLVINVEGNYNTFLSANQDKIGTVWNAWQTGWSGVVSQNVAGRVNNQQVRVIQTIRQDMNRQGIKTEVVPKVDEESQGFRHLYDTLIPFCRSKSIQFDGWGFKPNTRVYPYFDKKLVSAYTTPLSADYTSGSVAAGEPLVAGVTGKIEGTFVIPDPKTSGNPTFETGEVQFRLTSNSDNGLVPEPATAGDTIYFAKGILETHQETVIATRNAELVRSNVTQTTSSFSTNSILRNDPQDEPPGESDDGPGNDPSDDPLAQTFLVDKQGGAFITSVDLFFCSKDATLPMWVEIRNVVNGYPGPKILPFGRKVMYPADVTTSTDASVATKVTFPSPVYVEEGVEYTVALLAAAQINTWSVFIAKMGEVDIGGSRTISMQPHTGVLFKSHNNSAWAMSGMEDLKFNINAANFDITSSGTVTLQNSALPVKALGNNPIEFTDASQVLRFKHRNHGMYHANNNVTISGVSSGVTTTLNGAINDSTTTINLTSGASFDDTSGRNTHDDASLHWIKIGDEIISYNQSGISTNQISGGTVTRGANSTTAASHADGATVELYQIYSIPLTEVNKTHTAITNVGGVANGNQLDYYGITTSTNAATGMTAGETVSVGGSSITATQNQKMDVVQSMIGSLELPETSVSAKIRPSTSTSPSGTETSFSKVSAANAITIPLNDNYYFDVPYMAASAINETNEMASAKSLELALTLTSSNVNISPVIDTQRMSVFAVANRINKVSGTSPYTINTNYSPSTDPEGDDNAAIYCTKQVLLENPATAIRVLFAGHRLSNAEIKVMYKILRTDDASEFDDIGWTYFNTTGTTDTTTNTSLSEKDFQQYVYSAGVTDDGIGTALDAFIGFSIKIILQSTSSAEAPRLKDLRAIALAT